MCNCQKISSMRITLVTFNEEKHIEAKDLLHSIGCMKGVMFEEGKKDSKWFK